MASALLFERHPLERTVWWRIVANELSMMLVVRRCFQCSAGTRRMQAPCREQALDRLLVFDAPCFDEDIEGHERILLGLGYPDLLECAFGFGLLALGQLVQDIGGLVQPNS